MRRYVYSTVNDRIQELDIAEGLKQLLRDAGLTIELIVRLDYQDISEMLNIDPYVGKLIFEAAQNVIQERTQREIIVTK
jgi:hypothetical protein